MTEIEKSPASGELNEAELDAVVGGRGGRQPQHHQPQHEAHAQQGHGAQQHAAPVVGTSGGGNPLGAVAGIGGAVVGAGLGVVGAGVGTAVNVANDLAHGNVVGAVSDIGTGVVNAGSSVVSGVESVVSDIGSAFGF